MAFPVNNNASYEQFAHVYDFFMADAPYEKWAAYIDRKLTSHFSQTKREALTILDLACGTGNITIPLAKKGYDMIGADRSADMLAEARDKADAKGLSVLLLVQDMRRLDLYGTVDAVLCVCDGLNYLLNEQDLSVVFSHVANYLNPGGVFIFDMNTEYKFKEVLRDNTFTEIRGDLSYIWKNRYDTHTCINEYVVHFFLQDKEGSSERFEEVHYQRAYPVDTVINLLQKAGLFLLNINEAYTDRQPTPECERVSFMAIKQV